MIFKQCFPKFPLISCRITKVHRISAAVGKHIIAEDALAGRNERIGIDEPAYFGIVITGLEVVERGLSVLVVTPTSK